MEQQSAEHAAFTMLSEASRGQDISRRYNSLTSEEQKQVFTEMKSLQMNSETSKLFGNVDLFDSNQDGRMDDARWASRNGITRDVYDSHADKVADSSSRRSQEHGYERVQAARPADEIATPAKASESLTGQGQNETNRVAGENMQSRNYQRDGYRYGENGGGNRNHEQRSGNGVEERLGRSAENALGRGAQILADEALRGLYRNGRHGPNVGERIERRLGQEARTGTNRVLRDMMRRH